MRFKFRLLPILSCLLIGVSTSARAAALVDFGPTSQDVEIGYTAAGAGTGSSPGSVASPFVVEGLSDPDQPQSNITVSISGSITGNTISFRDRGDFDARSEQFGGLQNLYEDFIRTGTGGDAIGNPGANPYTTMTISFTGLLPNQQYEFTGRIFDPSINPARAGNYRYSITGTGDAGLSDNSYSTRFSNFIDNANTGGEPDRVLDAGELRGYTERFVTDLNGALSITIQQLEGAESTVPLNSLELAAVPEPGSAALILSGAIGLMIPARRRGRPTRRP